MKRKLLKVIGISFLIYVVLSWIIPVGTYANGELTTNGIDPVGLIDLFNAPIQAFITFILYGVVFATIGGFYGVMQKTGALEKVTDGIGRVFKDKEKGFLALTVVLFVILSSVTGLILPLFILVPLFAAVLFAMNYDKVTVLASTVGSLLVGSIASTYGFNITGYTANLLALDMNNQIVARIVLLVILTIAFVCVVLMTSKRNVKKEIKEAKTVKEEKAVKGAKKENATKTKTVKKTTKTAKTGQKTTKTTKKSGTKTTSKKKTSKSNTKSLAVSKSVKKVSEKSKISAVPLVIIFLLMLILCLVGMYNWYYAFGVDVFNNIHEAIMGVEIKDFPIFEHLLSGISELGYWSNIELSGAMIITSGIIAWIYKLSLNDYVNSFIAGVRKWMPTACYAALASVILYILYQASYAGTGTLVDTINAKVFELNDGFNVLTTGFASLLASFFYNDLYYLLAGLSTFVTGFDAASLSVAGVLIQSIYGIGMIIFPTSVILIAGLSLFDVSYKQWIKYIWKFALVSLLLVLLVCGILTLL